MNHNSKNTLLHLSLIPGIGPATIEKIVDSIGLENLSRLYKLNISDLYNLLISQANANSDEFDEPQVVDNRTSLTKNILQKIMNGLADQKLLDQELNLINANSIKYITIYDESYPQLLKKIYLPPIVLYIKGEDLSNFENNVAIVGSRKADAYGFKVVNQLVPEVADLGFNIVSGGALGIDTFAHQACINNNLKTIAVLGSGLLRPYPSNNVKLFDSISKNNGSIISPFPLLAIAKPENFPARNRIISGLSLATIVIQAADPSGALITAQYALDQGREVGAVPGAIDNILSAGCHKLISQGAAIITNINDVKSMLGLKVESVINKSIAYNSNQVFLNQNLHQQSFDNINQLNFANEQNQQSSLQKVDNKKVNIQNEFGSDFTIDKPIDLKQTVISYLTMPIDIDQLLQRVNLPMSELQELLCTLQLEGIVDQNFMGMWHLV